MRFTPTAIAGVVLIEFDAAEDSRGFFARTFCEEEFARAGIAMQVRQMNVSHNRDAFTLRGLHYQAAPYAESKIVHCVRGRIFDVAADLRPGSPTFRRWVGFELAPELRRALYVAEGCAHGFLTLEPASDVFYAMSHPYVADAGRGVRWNDSALGIEWPAIPRVISERDMGYSDLAAWSAHGDP
jgi:dTDP-4-dehydrorhamnose 3,5-epimerase